MTAPIDQLAQYRASIDNLDAILLHTLAERFKVTQAVGKLKAENDMALTQWGDDWLSDGATPPISFTHAKSRQTVRPAFVDEDGKETKMSEMRVSLRR